ncbi:MAG: hypothetical protein ACT4PT_13615 [Methanobacteriota archaeon]
MERIDLAIILLGIGVALASFAGVALYEDAGGEFRIVFAVTATTLEPDPAGVSGNGEFEIPFEVSTANLTKAYVNVSLSAPGPRAQTDTVTVRLVPAGAEEDERTIAFPVGAAASEVAAFELDFGPPPEPRTVRAASGSAAFGTVPPRLLGIGTWRIVVSVEGSALPIHNERHEAVPEVRLFHYSAGEELTLPEPAR